MLNPKFDIDNILNIIPFNNILRLQTLSTIWKTTKDIIIHINLNLPNCYRSNSLLTSV